MIYSVQPLRREPACPYSDSNLQFFHASARSSVRFSGSGCLVLALRTPVRLSFGQQRVLIPRFGAYFIAIEAANLVQAESEGPWLLLRAEQLSWRALLSQVRATGPSTLQPIAGLWSEVRALSAWALRLTRALRGKTPAALTASDISAFAAAMAHAMAGFDQQIESCPGRIWSQKTQVFRRLMRVRQYIDFNCTESLGIECLAGLANYSRAHFMTVFRTVFGETPHAQVLERRLHHARHMLSEVGLSVSETTVAVGFEDRSSFSKLFRRRFGVTAKATRRHALVAR